MIVGGVDGVLLVGGDAVKVTSLVGYATFLLLVVLGPVEKKVEGTVCSFGAVHILYEVCHLYIGVV